MIQIRIFIFVLLLGVAFPSAAQRIYFCANFTAEGDPLLASDQWLVDSVGKIFILFEADSASSGKMHKFVVRYEFSDSATAGDSLSGIPAGGKGNTVAPFAFKRFGRHFVSVCDETGAILATDTVRILRADPEHQAMEQRIVPCSGILENGSPSDSLTKVLAVKVKKHTEHFFFLFTSNPRGLSTDEMTLDIWKVDPKGPQSFIESRQFEINEQWDHVRIPVTLSDAQPGKYLFMLYNAAGVFLGKTTLHLE